MNRGVFLLVAILVTGVCLADGAKFASPPVAEKLASGVKVRFAVAASTDVEVAILDAEGKVVRHLAAGLLGGTNPPPEPLKPGLVQEVAWDGQDDFGRPAKGGPFKARVGLGLSPVFDKIIGWSGQQIDRPRGLACGPDGTLYAVFGDGLYAHRQTTLIAAYDRDGKYLRQVFPGPANLPPQKRQGWPWVRPDGGEEMPVVFHATTRCPYPGAVFGERVFPAATRDGRLVMLSGSATGSTIADPVDMRGGRRLLILGTDGSVPADYLGPIVAPENLGGFGHVALSPDDRFAYVAGLFEAGKAGKGFCNVVWRVRLDGSAPAEVFVGKLYEAGKGRDGLNDPHGLATDKDGNLYIADYANDRVAVFTPDGAFLAEIKIDRPDQVLVHRASGAVYVVSLYAHALSYNDGHWYTPSHTWKAERIVKFASLKDPTEKASFAPRVEKFGGGAQLALDESAGEPVLWFVDNGWGRRDVTKIIDRGDKLESLGDPIAALAGKDETLPFIGDLTVADKTLIVRSRTVSGRPIFCPTFDAETGMAKGRFVPVDEKGAPERADYFLCWCQLVAGWDGRLIHIHGSGINDSLRRYDLSGKPAPFSATGSYVLAPPPFPNRQTHNTTLFVNRAGDVYCVVRKEGNNRASWDGRGYDTTLCVRVVGADGTVKHESLVSLAAAKLGGLAADSKGNVYIGAQTLAEGETQIPSWFRDKLPPDGPNKYPSLAYHQYGTILKFPAAGGQLVQKGKTGLATEAVGVVWARRGGLVPRLKCTCEATRLDIDEYDRLFVPDIFRFSVRVLDAAGNEITHFGRYGNMDSRGPGSPVPEPAIPLGWPICVDYSGGRVYVADLVNRRVVAVRLENAVEADCAVP